MRCSMLCSQGLAAVPEDDEPHVIEVGDAPWPSQEDGTDGTFVDCHNAACFGVLFGRKISLKVQTGSVVLPEFHAGFTVEEERFDTQGTLQRGSCSF